MGAAGPKKTSGGGWVGPSWSHRRETLVLPPPPSAGLLRIETQKSRVVLELAKRPSITLRSHARVTFEMSSKVAYGMNFVQDGNRMLVLRW